MYLGLRIFYQAFIFEIQVFNPYNRLDLSSQWCVPNENLLMSYNYILLQFVTGGPFSKMSFLTNTIKYV